MGKTLDLGHRVEIQPMDKHCHDISLGLYQQEFDGSPHYLVHTYSSAEAAPERVAFIRQAMVTMLGMEANAAQPEWFRFSCGDRHEKAAKRAFLDLCKLASGSPLEPKACTNFDKKADCDLSITGTTEGIYRASAAAETDASTRRIGALIRGFMKVCEMLPVDDSESDLRFTCGGLHNEMVGMLLFRAQNVRSAMQEDAASAGRGSLAPPSQQ